MRDFIQNYLKNQKRIYYSNYIEIQKTNYTLLIGCLYSLCCISFCLLILSIFTSLNIQLLYIYGSETFLTFIASMLFKKYDFTKYTNIGFYFLTTILFLHTYYISICIFSDKMTIGLIGLYCIIPLAFLDKSLRINCYMILTYIIYTTLSFSYKSQRIVIYDAVSCACFLIVGLVIGEYVRKTRICNLDLKHKLQVQTETDYLTGLFNRRKMSEVIQASPQEFGIIMFDIDNFKKFNDYYGHIHGDVCLRKIGLCLKEISEKYKINIYRYGGEEFLAFCKNPAIDILYDISEKIRQQIWELHIEFEQVPTGRITVSVGYASPINTKSKTTSQLILDADRALYRAKAAGRNTVSG